MGELNAIGNSINQLAAKANTIGFVDALMLKEATYEKIKEYAKVQNSVAG